jgi:hypothetical protein
MKEVDVSEHARMASFDVGDAALDALLDEIGSSDRPPDGVPATRIIELANRSAGKVVVGVRFGSEEDLPAGSAVLDAMSPSDAGTMRRTSVTSSRSCSSASWRRSRAPLLVRADDVAAVPR